MCCMSIELPMHLSLSKGVAQEVLYDSWGCFFAANVFREFFAANVWIVVARLLPSASTNKCSIFVRTTSGILVLFWSLLVLVPPRHANKKRRESGLILKINIIYTYILYNIYIYRSSMYYLGYTRARISDPRQPGPPHTVPTSSLSYRVFFHSWLRSYSSSWFFKNS